ncbi:MAG TPA: hypothetical protein PKH83_02115 [Cyclobacteriaceae bacterium]|nr:hypothetical protein [Cyclobacteriaceae bacterium]
MKRILLISLLLISISNAYSQTRTEIKMYKTFGGARFEMDTLVLSPKQVLQVLKAEPLAYEKFKRAKANYNAAGILGFAGGVLIGLPIGTAIGGGNPEWGLAAAGGVLVLGSFSLTAVFRSHAFDAIELYNGKTARIKPQVQFYGTGVRIVMRF